MAAVTTPTATSTAPAMSENDRRAHDLASYVRAPRVAAVGVISRTARWTVSTVRTAEGVTGTVTAVR